MQTDPMHHCGADRRARLTGNGGRGGGRSECVGFVLISGVCVGMAEMGVGVLGASFPLFFFSNCGHACHGA